MADPVAAERLYEWMWDLMRKLHLKAHPEPHARRLDFNCCDEWAALMAVRSMSRIKEEFPIHLLKRLEAMEPVDREFFVEHILSTDGETEPAEDEEAKREYRAVRRHHALWTELKHAAARIDELEQQLRARAEPAPE